MPRARDLLDTQARFAAIFMPPSFPPAGALWTAMSHLHVSALFLNNYGVHELGSRMRLLAFNWDWTGMAAPIAGCGCITVNGQLCAWTRWTGAGLDRVDDLVAFALGGRVYDFEQIARA